LGRSKFSRSKFSCSKFSRSKFSRTKLGRSKFSRWFTQYDWTSNNSASRLNFELLITTTQLITVRDFRRSLTFHIRWFGIGWLYTFADSTFADSAIADSTFADSAFADSMFADSTFANCTVQYFRLCQLRGPELQLQHSCITLWDLLLERTVCIIVWSVRWYCGGVAKYLNVVFSWINYYLHFSIYTLCILYHNAYLIHNMASFKLGGTFLQSTLCTIYIYTYSIRGWTWPVV
jgi:hypothetical protein